MELKDINMNLFFIFDLDDFFKLIILMFYFLFVLFINRYISGICYMVWLLDRNGDIL